MRGKRLPRLPGIRSTRDKKSGIVTSGDQREDNSGRRNSMNENREGKKDDMDLGNSTWEPVTW